MGALRPRHRLLTGACHVPHNVRQRPRTNGPPTPQRVAIWPSAESASLSPLEGSRGDRWPLIPGGAPPTLPLDWWTVSCQHRPGRVLGPREHPGGWPEARVGSRRT